MEGFAELKTRILENRPICEICGHRRAVELHHCIVHDSKDLHKLVTVEENLMPVCQECHPYANGLEVRIQFAYRQIREYHYDIAGWYNGLPLKFKERWLQEIERS